MPKKYIDLLESESSTLDYGGRTWDVLTINGRLGFHWQESWLICWAPKIKEWVALDTNLKVRVQTDTLTECLELASFMLDKLVEEAEDCIRWAKELKMGATDSFNMSRLVFLIQSHEPPIHEKVET